MFVVFWSDLGGKHGLRQLQKKHIKQLIFIVFRTIIEEVFVVIQFVVKNGKNLHTGRDYTTNCKCLPMFSTCSYIYNQFLIIVQFFLYCSANFTVFPRFLNTRFLITAISYYRGGSVRFLVVYTGAHSQAADQEPGFSLLFRFLLGYPMI